MARTYSSGTAQIKAFNIHCVTPGCESVVDFQSGTAAEFYEAFNEVHYDGWLCLVESILDMTCPRCNATPRSYPSHRLLRHKLAHQPEWKQDVVLTSWAAMAQVGNGYLRETEMPIALCALLHNDKTPSATHVRHALEQIERALSRRAGEPNAAEAARLARVALGRH